MNTSIVVSPARPFQALTPDDLRRAAPSIYAEHAYAGVSSRYTFVSTAQVVALLAAEGWAPVTASEQRVRLETRMGFQLHEIRFARRADLDTATWQVGSTRAELILQNAHDGTHAYRIDAGLYRMVCRNGLTVADTEFAHVAIRHIDLSAEVFAEAAHSVAELAPQIMRTVTRWQGVQLSPAQRTQFARRAAALRWDPAQPVVTLLNVAKLLAPVRSSDAGNDLWTTFNVVQEHLLRGGDRYLGYSPGKGVRRNTTRPVAGLNEGQKLNKALWSLAAEFANRHPNPEQPGALPLSRQQPSCVSGTTVPLQIAPPFIGLNSHQPAQAA